MKKNVLIVDDDDSITISLKIMLEESYNPTAVSSGEEALEQLKHNHYDAVLLDYLMEGIDGLETLRQIRNTDRDIVVIMLSVIDNQDVIEQANRFGVNHYLCKPYKKDDILQSLNKNLA